MYPRFFPGTPFEIPSWWLCLFAGYFVSMVLALLCRPKDFPLSPAAILMMYFSFLVFGLLGGEALALILRWRKYASLGISFLEKLSKAGYAYLGTLTALILVIAAFAKLRIKRISFFVLADYFMPFVVLHQAFQRIGCFLTGCCGGSPTNMPWGVPFGPTVPGYLYLDKYPESFHPTQLYNMTALFVNFFLMRHFYKKGVPNGVVFFGSVGLYGFFRFFTEFFRVDSPRVMGVITQAHIAASIIALAGGLGVSLILIKRRSER